MRKAITLFAAILLVATAGLAHAQVRATGSIQGSVTDADGAPLPGVQITAESESLIGQQVVYTGGDGSYRLTLLPPGTYTLRFELQGFSTVVQENVDVGVRRTTSVNAQMRLASVEETITVTARSPIVDIKSTKRSSEYGDDLRNSLPETRGVGGDMMNLAPEATPAGSSGTTGGASFFGSPTSSNSFQVDGVTVTDPGGGAQFPFYSPDWFDVVEITSTGAGAEYGKAQGSVFNVVTKSGGNSFHGEGNLFFQNNSFIGDNVGDGISNPFTGEPAQQTDFTIAADLDHRYDVTANIGGPLIRDKVWFFFGYQLFDEEFQEPGVRFAATQNSDRFLGKVTWQVNQDNRLILGGMADTYTLGGRPSATYALEEATVDEPSMNLTPQVTWNSVLSPDAFLELKYSGFYGFFDLLPISEGPSSYDLGTGILSGAYWGTYTFDRTRTNFQGNVSYFAEDFAGDHSFKFGTEYEILGTDDHNQQGLTGAGVPVYYLPYFGEPYLAYGNDPRVSRNTSDVKVFTAYVQDDWTIADRVTVNLGLRWDRWDIGWKGGATRDDAPTFDDVAPRVGANLDVFGDGRTSLHAFWGRFYEEAHGSAYDDFDPNRADFVGYCSPDPFAPWCEGLPFAFTGDNGETWNEFLRIDPLSGRLIDPDLENTYSDQITVGLEHQLLEDVSVGVKYVRKRDQNILGSRDIGSTYEPVQVTTALGDTLTLYDAGADFDQVLFFTNDPWADLERKYDGVQFKVQKRLSNNWTAIASLMVQESEANFFTSSSGAANSNSTNTFMSDPNFLVGAPGKLINSRDWVFKLQASYLLPDPIRTLIGFQLDAMSSGRYTRTERFTGFSQGSVTVPIEQMGDTELDNQYELDLRAEKKFRLPGQWGDVGVLVDIFNVFNADTVVDVFTREPFYGDPEEIPNPREFRVGLRWIF